MTTPLSFNINFRERQLDDMALYDWAVEQLGPDNNPGSRSRLGREAFYCLRLFGSFEKAEQAQHLATALRAYLDRQITEDELREIVK